MWRHVAPQTQIVVSRTGGDVCPVFLLCWVSSAGTGSLMESQSGRVALETCRRTWLVALLAQHVLVKRLPQLNSYWIIRSGDESGGFQGTPKSTPSNYRGSHEPPFLILVPCAS